VWYSFFDSRVNLNSALRNISKATDFDLNLKKYSFYWKTRHFIGAYLVTLPLSVENGFRRFSGRLFDNLHLADSVPLVLTELASVHSTI
jgi:hypothetical protein